MRHALVPLLQPGLLALAAILLGIASLNDIAVRTIPDLAPLGLVVIGVAVRLADGSAAIALAASAAVFVFGAVCWRFGWLGGGDVKLLAACAWLVPPALVPQLVLLTAIAGGILACLYLALSWMARASRAPTCAMTAAVVRGTHPARGMVAYQATRGAALRLCHRCRHSHYPVRSVTQNAGAHRSVRSDGGRAGRLRRRRLDQSAPRSPATVNRSGCAESTRYRS